MFVGKGNFIFVCQINETYLKLAKCVPDNKGHKPRFISVSSQIIPVGDDKKIAEILSFALKGLGYGNNPLVISIPRHSVTLKYIKIPARSPQEIENIVSLQAPRFLPYPAEELITCYQVASVDNDGYSNINLVIAHKDIIERYIRIFKSLNITDVRIVLSSFGLANFSNLVKAEHSGPVMLVDIDQPMVEIAIVAAEKLAFSRSFKFSGPQENWGLRLVEEINKTIDSSAKDVPGKNPARIIIAGSGSIARRLAEELTGKVRIPIECMVYRGRISASDEVLNNLDSAECSFVNLLGLGSDVMPDSFNLLPRSAKSAAQKSLHEKQALRFALYGIAIVFVFMLGFAKNTDNKRRYLERLNAELKKVSSEARALEKLDKRSKLIESRTKKNISSLDVLYQLYKAVPEGISLTNLTYEQERDVMLRGQAPHLNAVFAFTQALEKNPVFSNFGIKVRYATKKKMQSGEFVDFEITCLAK